MAYYAMFTNFAAYDDEGVLLMTLRQYANGGVLYDQLYSRYGPAYFQLLYWIFHGLGLPFTHTMGRSVTIAVWLTTSALCGVAIYRLTRNLPVALCGQLLTCDGLLSLRNEPTHPGGLLCLILSAVVVAGSFLGGARSALAAAVIGGLLALATLIKINVGLLALAPTVFVLLPMARSDRFGRWLRPMAAAALVTAAPALMARQLGIPWVGTYATVVSSSVAAVTLIQLTRPAEELVSRRDLTVMILGFIATAVLSCAATLVHGTSMSGLLNGVLLDPLHSPQRYTVPLALPAASVGWALGSLAVCVGFLVVGRSRTSPWLRLTLGLAQAAMGLVVGTIPLTDLRLDTIAISLPWLWLALANAGDSGADPQRTGTRLVVTLAALQALHAYPVAGSQVDWATFLMIPAGAISLVEGWRNATAAVQEWIRVAGRAVLGALFAIVVLGLTAKSVAYDRLRQVKEVYDAQVPLNLPGAERIRVSKPDAFAYRWLSDALSTRCASFLTMPGLYSLYLFTDKEPPTLLTVTAWMTILSRAQQEEVRDEFARMPSPRCVIRNRRLVRIWTMGAAAGDVSNSPLVRYIDEQFVTIDTAAGYEFMMERSLADG